MNELIFYILKKYYGNWDDAYEAICKKETVDFALAKRLAFNYCPLMFWITKEDYPEKLKEIYMPPLAMFYLGNKKILEEKVLGFLGKIKKNKYQNILKLAEKYVLCFEEKELDQELYELFKEKNLKVIILLDSSINNSLFDHYSNALFITEKFQVNWTRSYEQNNERLLYAFSDEIMLECKTKTKILNLSLNQENILKPIYCLKKYEKEETIINSFNRDNLKIINDYNQLL